MTWLPFLNGERTTVTGMYSFARSRIGRGMCSPSGRKTASFAFINFCPIMSQCLASTDDGIVKNQSSPELPILLK